MSPTAAAGVPTSLCAKLLQQTTAPGAVSAATWAAGRTEPTIRCHWLATAGIAAARGCPCAVTTAQHNTDSVLEPGNGCVITQSHDPGCSLSSATAGDDGVSTRSAAPCPLAANSVTLVSCAAGLCASPSPEQPCWVWFTEVQQPHHQPVHPSAAHDHASVLGVHIGVDQQQQQQR